MKDGNNASKITVPDFPGKIWLSGKWGICAPNAPKMDLFAIYLKFCRYFCLQMVLNEKA